MITFPNYHPLTPPKEKSDHQLRETAKAMVFEDIDSTSDFTTCKLQDLGKDK